METLKRVARQTSWQILAKISSALSTLYVLSLVSRAYGVSGTGVYTLATTYLSFFYLIADFGVNAYILPQLLGSEVGLIWRKLLGFRLLLSLGLIVIALILMPTLPFSSPQFIQLVFLGLISIVPSAIFISANAYFQASLQYKYFSLATIFNSVFSALFAVWVVIGHKSLSLMIISPAGGWFVAAAISTFFIARRFSVLPIFDFGFVRKIVSASWPITLMMIANMLYFRVDSFILTTQKSLVETGIYNLPYSMFQAALVLPTFIMNGFYPLMIKHLQSDRARFFQEFKVAGLAMLGLGVTGTLVTLVLSPALVPWISGGKGFLASVDVLQILSLGFPAFFLSSLLMWVLVVFKEFKALLWIYVLALIVNVLLNLWLIPHYSYLGAAWVTTLCEYLILSCQVTILYRVVVSYEK